MNSASSALAVVPSITKRFFFLLFRTWSARYTENSRNIEEFHGRCCSQGITLRVSGVRCGVFNPSWGRYIMQNKQKILPFLIALHPVAFFIPSFPFFFPVAVYWAAVLEQRIFQHLQDVKESAGQGTRGLRCNTFHSTPGKPRYEWWWWRSHIHILSHSSVSPSPFSHCFPFRFLLQHRHAIHLNGAWRCRSLHLCANPVSVLAF